jgi:exodeoxyribonuclease VII large subunit
VMTARWDDAVARATERLDHARSRLRLLSPGAQIEQGFLRLDDLSNRLGAALRHAVQEQRRRLAEVQAEFARVSPQTRVEQESQKLLSLWKRLQAASPASVLNRGFAIMRDEAGRPVTRRAAVKSGARLAAEFADGTAPMRAE